jgi:hypothetical protein
MKNSVYSRVHTLKLYTRDTEATTQGQNTDWLELDEGDTAFPLQTEGEIAAVISFFFPYFISTAYTITLSNYLPSNFLF